MENQIIVGAVLLAGLAGVTIYLISKQKAQTSVYTDILSKEEYKVKGQWDK